MAENRQYLLGLIDEVLAYKPDGLILDFLKNQGDYRNQLTDSTGTAIYGYEPAAVREFQKKFSKDPFRIANDDADWVRFRAGYVTEFAREARRFVSKKAPGVRLLAQVWGGGQTSHFVPKQNTKPGEPKYEIVPYPVRDALYGTLCDVETWSREGLFDAIYPLVSTKSIDAYRLRIQTVQKLVAPGKSKAAAGAYIWGQPERTKEFVQAAVALGIAEIYLGESLPLEPNGWGFLRDAVESVR